MTSYSQHFSIRKYSANPLLMASFFTTLIDPSADHLPLPPDFASMHVNNKITNAPIIRSSNGGYSWRLKIKQIGDSYCLANGWNNVVKDIQLGIGDFLFFQLLDRSTFKMSVYSPDGCEKILPINIDLNEDDPFFMAIVTLSHARFLRFPGGFAELAGIDAEGSMTVKNLDGKEWVTGLKLDKSFRSSIRYFLSPGWGCFARDNLLSLGDECVFRFIRSEGKLSLAKVTKKGGIPVTELMNRSRGWANRGGDADVNLAEECVEVMKKPFEMPAKRRHGLPPRQKSRILFF